LFIYGPVGAGKTHLLEGLYREIRRTSSSLQVLFLTSEQFTNYFTQAYRDHTLPAFRQRFRTVDVLLVDDIDFLDAKRVVQEEFLHTFQQLESHGKLVVVCGDRHPRLLSKISEELKTRFLSGMVCRLEVPDLETRELIAVCKARKLDADFSPEALKYVAKRFSNSVRELEGALHCLQVYHRMTGKRVGMTAAREVLGDLERDCLRVVRMADIERAVCDLFGLDAADLKSARRARSVSEPRMMAMYLARRHTRAAYSEIGQFFGGRNHATVISADHKVTAWLAENAEVKVASQTWRLSDVLDALEQQLLAG
jgi:chromosomal replication initiator protein